MRPNPGYLWRLSAICLALALAALITTWAVRERAHRRELQIERDEWEIHKRTWSARHDEQQKLIERLFDSQDEWLRDVRQLKQENAKLRQDLAAAPAATRPTDPP